MLEFQDFGKIARLNRECVITEKIDGTNAQVFIDYKSLYTDLDLYGYEKYINEVTHDGIEYIVMFGSRNKWISKTEDNAGFANWASSNIDELMKLGPGHHYGEWWGAGIQRNYGMKMKVFSLFNTSRWYDINTRPSCCGVVPVLYKGLFSTDAVNKAIEDLRANGSKVAPGFMRPEGVIVFHTAANQMFKVTLEKDEAPKSLSGA